MTPTTRSTMCGLLFLLLIPNLCIALVQNGKQWFAINATRTLSDDERWLGFLYSQFRIIDNSHPWQMLLAEAGLGYQLKDSQSIWLGYRWAGQDPFNGFSQENRFFQQHLLKINTLTAYHFILRERLEEIERTNQHQIAVRFRERVALEIGQAMLRPFFYEEIFFQLNNTVYTPNYFFGQNRLFVGFNLMQSLKTWWEIGYINQFEMRTPSNADNQMSHILSFTYHLK